MDPVTAKMALQIALSFAKSKLGRRLLSAALVVALFFGGLSVYASWMVAAELAGSLRAAGIYSNCGVIPGQTVEGADAGSAAASARVMWPVPGHETGTYAGHSGVDINRGSGSEDDGDPIVAAASGVVTYVGTGHGYGEGVFVKTDIGPTNIYGHTSRQFVHKGERVVVGQLIADVGGTGHATAPHLHFGVDPGLTYQASMAFLKDAEPFKDPATVSGVEANAPPVAPSEAAPVATGLPKSSRWSAEQLKIASTAIAVGKAHGIPAKGWVVIIAAGLDESDLRNLNYGDRDSQGFLQQRSSAGWGSVEQIRDPALAASAFYGVADHTHNRGLTDVYNWENKSVAYDAQAVQVSRSGAYAKFEDEARAIVALLSGTPASSGSGSSLGTAPTISVTIVSWNSAHWNSIADTIAGARAIASRRPAAISFQELSGDGKQQQVEAALHEHYSFTSFDNQTKIAYNHDQFKLISEKQVLAFKTTHVESTGRPNSSVYNKKFIQYIVLEDRDTKAQFAVVNSHAPNAIESRGKPNEDHPIRVGLGVTMFSKMAAIGGPLASEMPTFVTMDANVDAKKAMKERSSKFPDAILGRVGFVSNYAALGFPKEASHGERAIDYVYSSKGNVSPLYQTTFGASGSDHAGIGLTARINTIMGACTGFAESDAAAIGASVGGGAVPANFDKQGNPRSVEEAVAWMQRQAPNGAPGEKVRNACERYMNLSYGLGGGYPTARAHWNAPGPRTAGSSTPPRGAVVFFDSSNPAGHVALSLGGGQVISTDFDTSTKRFRAGVIGIGSVGEVSKAMGGAVLGWRAPNFRVNSEG